MKKYIFLIVITVIVGALPLFVQYGDYVLMDDFFRQEIPFIMETKRMLTSEVPFWSWNTFFGDNFIAGYGFYTLTSPFVWLNCLLPYDWLLKGLFLTLILKYICAFLTARLYLRKMEVAKENAAIGGLMYAFSSYAISNSFYYHFFEPMIVFPLLLVAIERFLNRKRYGKTTLMLAAFLTVFINYYFAVCSFVAAAMYVFCRVLFSGKLKEYLRRVPLGLLLIVMGILLDSVLLIPTAMHLYGGGEGQPRHLDRLGLHGSTLLHRKVAHALHAASLGGAYHLVPRNRLQQLLGNFASGGHLVGSAILLGE